MRLTIGGHTVPAKNLDTAPLSAIEELQLQTGWPLAEVREKVRTIEATRFAIVIFLSLNAAGHPLTWDQVRQLSFDELDITSDPGDSPTPQEDAPADPPQASGDSSQDADAHEAEWPPAV